MFLQSNVGWAVISPNSQHGSDVPACCQVNSGVCLTTEATTRRWILALPAFYNATNNCCQQLPASSHFSAYLLRLPACSSVKVWQSGVR